MYLPKVIAYNAKDPTAKARYGVIADKMHLGGENDDEKVALLIQYLRGMNDDLNIPHCIGHYGPDSYPAEQGFVPECAVLESQPAPADPGGDGKAAEVLLLRHRGRLLTTAPLRLLQAAA